MKNPSTLWNSLKNTIYEKYGQESGKMIVHAGVITWITSSLSQVAAIMMNDKIPSDQKKFLIPQEIADGALNVLTFYLITNSLKNISGKLVSTGKWSTKAIRDFAAAKNIKLGDMSINLGKTFKEDKQFHDCYDQFKGGMDMIAASVGSVISCNAITPIIRNHFGADRQKDSIAKEQMQKKTNLYNPIKSNVNSYPATRNSMKV